MKGSTVRRLVLRPLLLSLLVLFTGPLMLYFAEAAGGPARLTLATALASFRTTGPLAAVMFVALLLLRWSAPATGVAAADRHENIR
jgi:hypothetical protein